MKIKVTGTAIPITTTIKTTITKTTITTTTTKIKFRDKHTSELNFV